MVRSEHVSLSSTWGHSKYSHSKYSHSKYGHSKYSEHVSLSTCRQGALGQWGIGASGHWGIGPVVSGQWSAVSVSVCQCVSGQ